MFTNELFAERLRAARIAAGKTQANLAEVLGVTPAQISDMERGNKTTTTPRLALICEYYNVSADYLLGLTDEWKPLK